MEVSGQLHNLGCQPMEKEPLLPNSVADWVGYYGVLGVLQE